MFPLRPGADKREALLAQAKADRLARSGQKQKEQQDAQQEKAARKIQAYWKRVQSRKASNGRQRLDWDILAVEPVPQGSPPAEGLVRNLKLAFLLLRFCDPHSEPLDGKRLALLCRILLSKTVLTPAEIRSSLLPTGSAAHSTSISPPDSPAQQAGMSRTLSSPLSAQPNSKSDNGPESEAGVSPELGASSDTPTAKPIIQVPFQMVLLHARYSSIASATILRLIRLCIKTIVGEVIDTNSPAKGMDSKKALTSPKRTGTKPSEEAQLYLSGPELRFLMAFVDLGTYRLPDTVAVAVRTQMFERGSAIVNKVLNSGQFYKDIRTGLRLRVKALTQLQDRQRRTSLTSLESARLKSLALWITAIWRCCVLFQSVDKDIQDKALESSDARAKANRQNKDNLINLYSDDSTIVGITCNILSIPLFVECLDDICIQLVWKHNILRDVLETVMDARHQQFILSSLTLNSTLSLLGNLIQLHRIHFAKNVEHSAKELKNRFVEVVVVLLTRCQQFSSSTQTTEFRQYHPVFSWTSSSHKDQQLSSLQVKLILQQLEHLWSREFALEIFNNLLKLSLPVANAGAEAYTSQEGVSSALSQAADKTSIPTSHHNRILSNSDSKSSGGSGAQDPQGALMAIEVQQACFFYSILMKSFEDQKKKILVTLMYLPSFLVQLWRFMSTLGPKGKMQIYLEAAVGYGKNGLEQEPLIAILQIFCECCARFFVTLDDDDMYEQQKPWELSELVFMSGFLNQFCFSVLSNQEEIIVEQGTKDSDAQRAGTGQRPPSEASANVVTITPPLPPIFYHARQVLLQLYERDCRRTFCPPNHWLLIHPTKSVFQSPLQLLASLTLSSNNNGNRTNATSSSTSKGTKGRGLFSFGSLKSPPQYATPKEFIQKVSQKDRTALQILETMSHVIPFSARLEIFRDFIKEEKAQMSQSRALIRPDLHQSVMVRVRRGYILEDGYQNLGQLSASGWKNTIRVKFVNEVGAEEAGIDQGGPFKEFMESFMEAGFSPNLNLFITTTESMNMVYPSPTSQYTHPQMGLELYRLFGKMLGKAMYEGLLVEVKFANFFLSKILGRTVFLDEMQSFDEQVFKNLMFLKKYEGDVEDLGLTFSLDEEVFGQHRIIDLMQGGKDVAVTRENRINYIFKVSDYRLNRQIQDQSSAFIDGFRSIIPLPWISIFSPQELHRVMAGDNVDFDVQDLRAHTDYQNGYFDQHPVIRNLWAVLNEFNSEEKRAFLKFVTSCSKPPLGGFKHLYPPFSIRLVLNPTVTEHSPSSGSHAPTAMAGSSMGDMNASSRSHNASGTNSSGSSPSTPGRSGNSSSFGSRLRSAFGTSGSNSSSNSNTANTPPTGRSATRTASSSSTLSSSSSSSSLTSLGRGSGSSGSPSRFSLTTDEHGTPATLGVVKSFFGGVLGGSGSSGSDSAGKKARLPTSSTCFNLLKLPPFTSKSILKEKLRYAIMSNTGFELS